ncbi:MAG: hypothetical protein V3V93_04780, partial [bacterium]
MAQEATSYRAFIRRPKAIVKGLQRNNEEQLSDRAWFVADRATSLAHRLVRLAGAAVLRGRRPSP